MQPLRWKVQKAITERGRQEGVAVLSVTRPGQLPIPKRFSHRQGSNNRFLSGKYEYMYIIVYTYYMYIYICIYIYTYRISKTLEVSIRTLISLDFFDPDEGLVTKTS